MSGSYLPGAPREAGRGAKQIHLRRCPHPSSLNVRTKYASLLGMSGALHLNPFDQPECNAPPIPGIFDVPLS
jgi:hypothetical protein